MSWSRFEPGFSRHPKRLKAGPIASWLWVASVDHCTEFRTDGFLDDAAIAGLCPTLKAVERARAVNALVTVNSWERVDGGYRVHGYLEHNQSAEQVEADRRAARHRYQKWRTGQRVDSGVHNGVTNGVAPPLQTDLSVSRSVCLSVSTTDLPEVSTGSKARRARRGQSGASAIALATDSDSTETEHDERGLAILAAAMNISVEEARARQRQARARATDPDAGEGSAPPA